MLRRIKPHHRNEKGTNASKPEAEATVRDRAALEQARLNLVAALVKKKKISKEDIAAAAGKSVESAGTKSFL